MMFQRLLTGLWSFALMLNLSACVQSEGQLTQGGSLKQEAFILSLDTGHPSSPTDFYVWHSDRPCPACPIVLFSHGAFSAPDKYTRLFDDWTGAGMTIIAPLHVDSRSHPRHDAFKGNAQLRARLADVAMASAAIAGEENIFGLDPASDRKIVVAGHSFGALVAQIAAGASVQGEAGTPIKLALDGMKFPLGVIAISPPGGIAGYTSAEGWSPIRSPMLVATGTHDVVPGFAPNWSDHLASHEAVMEARSVALIFEGMDHYFNGAYGRLQDLSADDELALGQLNAEIVSFAKHVASQPKASEIWTANDHKAVEIRVNPRISEGYDK